MAAVMARILNRKVKDTTAIMSKAVSEKELAKRKRKHLASKQTVRLKEKGEGEVGERESGKWVRRRVGSG